MISKYDALVPKEDDSEEFKAQLAAITKIVKDKQREILEGKHPGRLTVEGK